MARRLLYAPAMKLSHLVAALATIYLAATAPACKSSDDKAAKPSAAPAAAGAPGGAAEPAKPAKPAKTGRDIPNSAGLAVDAPARWQDNGIGGAAGLHLADDAGMFMVREASAEEAGKTLDQFKADTEAMLFQTWISAEATADGFEALWVMDALELQGDEMKKVGSQLSFHVRRTIGGKAHECTGTAKAEADAREAIALCKAIRGS